MVFKAKKAFSLAEVLITLGIIGIIATLVIPTLTQEIQDAQFRVAWKKAYADFDDATRRVILDNGGNAIKLCNDGDHSCLRDKYAQYLLYTKKCDSSNSLGNCWHNIGDSKWLSGIKITTWGAIPSLVLNNGALVSFLYDSTSCSSNSSSGTLYRCADIKLDINGFKGPNQVGKDIFNVWLTKDSLKPRGTQGDTYEPDCNLNPPSGGGLGCSARFLYQ